MHSSRSGGSPGRPRPPCRSGRPSRCNTPSGGRPPPPGVLDDGEGHVRLQGHEDPPGIGEGDHPVADQEVLVADVEVVLLKLAHLKTAVAYFSYQPRRLHGLLFAAQDGPVQFHGVVPFLLVI